MTLNVVTVSVGAAGSPGDASLPEGNMVCVPSGLQWPAAGDLPIVPMVVTATLALGTATAALVASDNFAAGVLTWNVIINIRGLPTIHASDLAVNFAVGPTQNIFDILQLNGWTPQQT
jgi:hypothetical protein